MTTTYFILGSFWRDIATGLAESLIFDIGDIESKPNNYNIMFPYFHLCNQIQIIYGNDGYHMVIQSDYQIKNIISFYCVTSMSDKCYSYYDCYENSSYIEYK